MFLSTLKQIFEFIQKISLWICDGGSAVRFTPLGIRKIQGLYVFRMAQDGLWIASLVQPHRSLKCMTRFWGTLNKHTEPFSSVVRRITELQRTVHKESVPKPRTPPTTYLQEHSAQQATFFFFYIIAGRRMVSANNSNKECSYLVTTKKLET